MVLFVSVPVAKSQSLPRQNGNPLKRHFLFQQHKLVVIVPTIGAADVAFTIKLLKLVDPVTAGLLLTTLFCNLSGYCTTRDCA
jgi:hypothetical protein